MMSEIFTKTQRIESEGKGYFQKKSDIYHVWDLKKHNKGITNGQSNRTKLDYRIELTMQG